MLSNQENNPKSSNQGNNNQENNKEDLIQYQIVSNTFNHANALLFVGNGNIDFGCRVASCFQPSNLSKCRIDRFANGEIKIPKIKENIRKRDCIVIQSICDNIEFGSVNDLLMELFVLIDAIRRGSAASITVVLPMFPYQRQDRKDCSRAPISAGLIASFLENLGVSRVICFDLHAEQIQGFFQKIPLDNLFTEPYFISYIEEKFNKEDFENLVIVSPDEGGVKRATRISKKLNKPAAIMYKERNNPGEIRKMILMGDVSNKICFMVDDMIDTAGTACHAAQVLKDNGAKEVYMGVCHGVLSKSAVDRISKSVFTKVIVTNTLPINERFTKEQSKNKLDVLDVSNLCANAIDRSLTGQSLSELMDL